MYRSRANIRCGGELGPSDLAILTMDVKLTTRKHPNALFSRIKSKKRSDETDATKKSMKVRPVKKAVKGLLRISSDEVVFFLCFLAQFFEFNPKFKRRIQ